MSLKYGMFSLLAMVLILFLIFKNYEIWTRPMEAMPEKGAVKKSGTKVESPPALTWGQPDVSSFQSFIFVAEKNIFRPDRKDFPVTPDPTKDPTKEKKPIVRPQIALYGVMIAGEYRSASISQVGRVLQKGEREIMTIKIGDQVGGYKLTKILPDRIGLEAPEDNFEVFLYDARVPKKRIYARTENKPAAITSTLPAPASPSAAAPSASAPAGAIPGGSITPRVTETRAPTPLTPAPLPIPRRRTSGTSLYDRPSEPAENLLIEKGVRLG